MVGSREGRGRTVKGPSRQKTPLNGTRLPPTLLSLLFLSPFSWYGWSETRGVMALFKILLDRNIGRCLKGNFSFNLEHLKGGKD